MFTLEGKKRLLNSVNNLFLERSFALLIGKETVESSMMLIKSRIQFEHISQLSRIATTLIYRSKRFSMRENIIGVILCTAGLPIRYNQLFVCFERGYQGEKQDISKDRMFELKENYSQIGLDY